MIQVHVFRKGQEVRDLGLFSREAQRYLQDIYDHMVRVVESVEDYQDLASGALEASLAVISNRDWPGGSATPGRSG
jgi:Mg2+ and Co2+ transporter CorA